jgi:hypothetical protein
VDQQLAAMTLDIATELNLPFSRFRKAWGRTTTSSGVLGSANESSFQNTSHQLAAKKQMPETLSRPGIG